MRRLRPYVSFSPLLVLAACAGGAGSDTGDTGALFYADDKAPAGEYCDGEDNDGDGQVDEDCATCEFIVGRGKTFWQNAGSCVFTGGATDFALLPQTVGTTTYTNATQAKNYLRRAAGTDARLALGQQLLVLKLNVATFKTGSIPYHNIDAVPDLETIDEIVTWANGAYASGNTSRISAASTVVTALNAEGNTLPLYFDPTCTADPEICNGVDDDGDGVVDDGCGCVEVCDGYDNDADGATDEGFTDGDGDGFASCLDCDDGDAAVNPGAAEVADGLDNNCDGNVDEGTSAYDDDGDGYTEDAGDCDDTAAGVHPGATERRNVVDDDCDGLVDNHLPTYDDDGDGRTENVGDCDDADPTVYTGAPELLDGLDNDCDGLVDDGTAAYDDDGDGQSENAGDCDDGDPAVYLGAAETVDGLDNDCDGLADEGTAAYDDDGDGQSENAGDCNDGNSSVYTGAPEIVNGLDDNCDGRADEGTTVSDDDGDGQSEADGDCDDADPSIFNGAVESVNGRDDDCDGRVDDGTSVYDDDADGQSEVSGDCDDANPFIFTGAFEQPNGIDDDCDGSIDEFTTASDDDGDGYTELGGDCNDAAWTIYPGAAERPNGIDEDCDGVIDEGTSRYDDDGDGFTETAGDCNDADVAVFPGQTEAANGIDDDCDGGIDEGTTNYDDDGDGQSEAAGDCDDADPGIYLGATDTPGDGIDQDCDGHDDSVILTLDDIGAGDLIITEVMQNPLIVADTAGEWFELYNATTSAVDLAGLIIYDVDSGGTVSSSFTVSGPLVVEAGDHVVLGLNSNVMTNGGVTVDYVYTGFTLGNAADEIILHYGPLLIDEIAYDDGSTFPDPNGASMGLDLDSYDASLNDYGANWCTSTSTMSAGDHGTPGQLNDDCTEAAPDADGDGYDATIDCDDGDSSIYPGAPEILDDGIDQDCDGVDSVTPTTLLVTDLVAGDLVITEVMKDPSKVGDTSGEWFEIYNNAGADVDLLDLKVYDVNATGGIQSSFVVSSSLVVPAGGYVVLGTNGTITTNGGVSVNYVYSSAWALANADDEIYLSYLGYIFDSITYDNGVAWPDPVGSSFELKAAFLNATDNDNGANWCTATSTYGLGDKGTPGAANDC